MAGTRLQIVGAFVAFVLLLAPAAWHLTSVERVDLPVDRIRRLLWTDSQFAAPPKPHVALYVVNEDPTAAQGLLASLQGAQTRIAYSVEIIVLSDQEKRLWSQLKTAQDVDAALKTAAKQDAKRFNVFLLCDESTAKQAATASGQTADPVLVVGQFRHAWSTQCSRAQQPALTMAIETLAHEHVFPTAEASASASKRARAAVSYRVQLSLLKETPALAWQWNTSTVVPQYLMPFLRKVSVLANFTVETQTLHYARLGRSVEPNADGSAFFLPAEDLKHFKSTNDFLTTSVLADREQVLHFMAALPDLAHSPLLIRDAQSQRVASSFEIPGWGGVVVLKSQDLVQSNAALEAKEVQRLMGLFLTQFRTLLGVPSFRQRQQNTASTGITFLPSVDAIADWELDFAVESLFERHVRSTIDALQSIMQLVDEMSQMSVLERVQSRIIKAVTLLEDILCLEGADSSGNSQQCEADSNLHELLAKAREAVDHADTAYYDHTMIRQLYFPQEQLFGVYAPLLAPLFLPFIMGLVRETKRWKAKKRAALAKQSE